MLRACASISASYPVIFSTSCSALRPVTTSTSNSRLSSAMPLSAICSATSTFIAMSLLPHEDGFGGLDAAAALELISQLGERHLERRERDDDVEVAEVAQVAHPEDAPGVVVLASSDRDAVLVLHDLDELLAVDALGHPHGGDGAAAALGRCEQLHAERLTTTPGGLREPGVTGDDTLDLSLIHI